MGLAEADAGVDVERIEHHAVAAACLRHLLGGRMGERVGAADHERVEGQARIERRAAKRIVDRRDRRAGAAHDADVPALDAHGRRSSAARPAAWPWARACGCTADRTAELDAGDRVLSPCQQASSFSA